MSFLLFRYTGVWHPVVGCLLIAALLLSQVGPSQQTAGALVIRTTHGLLKSHPITRYIYGIFENARWVWNFVDFLWTGPPHKGVMAWLFENPPPILNDWLPSWILDYIAESCDYYNLPACTKSVKLLQYVV